MSDFQDIIYQKHHRVRGAAWITINRPDVMNAFTGQTLTEMRDAVEAACADPEVGVIVITGASCPVPKSPVTVTGNPSASLLPVESSIVFA